MRLLQHYRITLFQRMITLIPEPAFSIDPGHSCMPFPPCSRKNKQTEQNTHTTLILTPIPPRFAS